MKKISFILLGVVSVVFYLYWSIILKSFEEFACWLYPFDESRNAELLKILLTVIGALGILFGLYLNYKRTKLSDKAIQLQSLAISKQSDQLELSRKSQIDERFKNAVEHLGNDKEPIILGGIAVLNQIAIENSRDYAEVVFNILTSYIRSSTNIYTKKADDFSSTVVQTIINDLFKHKDKINNPYKDFKGNLSHCNLSSINIDDIDFSKFDLSFTYFNMNINNVNFSNANLSKAQFILSRIKDTIFFEADLHQTLFNMAQIENASFESATVLATNFLTTHFFKVNFDSCDFSNAKFICCFFSETTHANSKIINNDFSFSSFKNVSFENTEIFSGINLKGSLFNNFKINIQSLELNFNGCNVLNTNYTFDYCQLIDKLEVKTNEESNVSQIVNLHDAMFYNQFTFGVFTEEEVDETKKKHDDILKGFEITFKKDKKNKK
ncbi:pentapeptide repeat-containing protein [Flavobacterium sp. WLB]|uniref:pentapeptide repeat-containing protein n=1 Tax=unclassified Flavobacterium TaxID=196869 RepID=UPI0006AB9471|nr:MULTISPECIES: pentapeptide repeat-containing protein [unclassified Flavobacterium]KOP36246.1 hypothetical protein AKO67_20335 [Flavobacterium sp. VMW]OWU90480.1 hypothetical protein APR43_13080 [Flavobacterium sp. NLM]PUU70555.1 pentapeptide repeat-containing protein [Flavobacterium sp. WLB]